MNTADKCLIIEQYVRESIEKGANEDFITYNDLGIPLAICLNAGIAQIIDNGAEIIDETWELLCDRLELDKNKPYGSLEEMYDDSPTIEDDDE